MILDNLSTIFILDLEQIQAHSIRSILLKWTFDWNIADSQ